MHKRYFTKNRINIVNNDAVWIAVFEASGILSQPCVSVYSSSGVRSVEFIDFLSIP